VQLDHTRIVVRERSFSERLDLALRVMRVHFPSLAVAALVGCAPMVLFNNWLLGPVFDGLDLKWEPPLEFLFLNLLLVVWETPLATSLMTLYLGQATFEEKPSWTRIARDFRSCLPQLIGVQLILRGLITLPMLTWLWLYAARAYLNEVILLERNPWRRRRRGVGRGRSKGSETDTMERAFDLHRSETGPLVAGWMASLVIGTLLMLAIWHGFWWLRATLFFEDALDRASYTIYWQVATWLVIGYFTVVRFLGYLDLRIRREGWEIELRMRAEGERLERQLT